MTKELLALANRMDEYAALYENEEMTQAAISLRQYSQEREREERLLDAGWNHSKANLTGMPAHVWWRRRKDVAETDRHSAFDRDVAALLAETA